jgi:hypothetical protein
MEAGNLMTTLERIERELAHMPEAELDKVLAFLESLEVAHSHPQTVEESTPEEDEVLAHWNCS